MTGPAKVEVAVEEAVARAPYMVRAVSEETGPPRPRLPFRSKVEVTIG